MTVREFTLSSLMEDLDGGRVGQAFVTELKRVVADMEDRPGDDKDRIVQLTRLNTMRNEVRTVYYQVVDAAFAGEWFRCGLPRLFNLRNRLDCLDVAEICAADFLRRTCCRRWPLMFVLFEREGGEEIRRLRIEMDSRPVFKPGIVESLKPAANSD